MFFKCSHHGTGALLAEVVIDDRLIEPGETYFAVYVDRPRGIGRSVVADLAMGLVGPVTPEQAQQRKLSGFELPALEMLDKAHARAAEQGVRRILLVDPLNLLSLARINRYKRR